MSESYQPAAQTLQWLERIVVGLNLCPFAAPVIDADALEIVVSDAVGTRALLDDTVSQLQRLQTHSAAAIETVLIVFSHDLGDFEDFLEFTAFADEAIDALSLRGEFQLASFHPHYQFDGLSESARENYTNRAPWPMLHVLREHSVSKAISAHPDTASIPERNQQLLSNMSDAAWRTLFCD
ncbi:MAG: DUF1415 domain-containing protein [Pseudomonadota bacterium]